MSLFVFFQSAASSDGGEYNLELLVTFHIEICREIILKHEDDACVFRSVPQ